MNLTPLASLINSRKAWIALLAVVGACVLAYFGKIPYDHLIDFFKWVIAAWFAAFAAEDISKAMGNKPSDSPPVVNVTTPNPDTHLPIDKVLELVQAAIAANVPTITEKKEGDK
jgi:hypothetical protein